MGICFVSITATDSMIEKVHETPALIWRLYAPGETEFYLSEIGADKKPSLLSRLFGKKTVTVPNPIPSFEYKQSERFDVDLDKSWDGINFCLKKILEKDAPNIFEGGEQVGNVEVGYGPATTFSSSQVHIMSALYSKISGKRLCEHNRPKEMGKVYPKTVWQNNDVKSQSYLIDNFKELQMFLKRASELHLGIVIIYT